jgi:para-nitrobenzyl esterase
MSMKKQTKLRASRLWTRVPLLLALCACQFAANAASTVKVDGGLLQDQSPDQSGIRSFKGIPYAAAPVGDLRWKPTAPVTAWNGVRSTSEWGARCMQSNRLGPLDPLNQRMDEDCLYLNIWTPAKAATAAHTKLPVMVWIHGGSNSNGAASQPEYMGAKLARNGVIVVSLNYRLDVFGYLAHPDLTKESSTMSSGNYGLLDQIAALKWVQKNIAEFGGDPQRVTVFGESAGAIDVSLLMVSPLTSGLFSRAIGESGAALSRQPGFGPKVLATGESDGLKFAQSLNAGSIAEMRAMPATAIMEAAAKAPITYGLGVVDGYVVPEHPSALYAKGKQQDVPLLAGFNADEGTLFALRMKMPDGVPALAGFMKSMFGASADQVMQVYAPGDSADGVKSSFNAIIGDAIIGFGSWQWAESVAAQNRAPVYRYYFTRRPPGAPQASVYPLAAPGVYHFAEINYVFNNFEVRPDWKWSADDTRLGQVMAGYWTNFAKTGNPNGGDLPSWDRYVPGGFGKVMELGSKVGMREEPNRSRYQLFHDVQAK